MRTFTGIADLESAVGEHLGSSAWQVVDQATIDRFAEATGDHQWIHTDPERAKDGPFGTTIAHGFLSLSLLPSILWQILEVQGLAMQVNYGCNSVRFPAPLPAGSLVRGGAELLSVDRGPQGARVVIRATVERQGEAKPVCVAEMVTLMAEA
jgi:acyl dehydratase